MKKNLSMSDQEILDLIHISIDQLTKLVGGKVQYCNNIAGKQNESNYFVVNNNISEIYPPDECETGYIVPHSLELGKRPKGAIFYINKNDYNVIKTQIESIDKKKGRPKLGKPAGWAKIIELNDYKLFFHRGHLIAYSLGGDNEIQGHDCKALKSLFTQTAWSNMGKANKKKEEENKFSQWHFEKIIKDTVVTDSVCMASRPIYRNKTDVIPIGVHLQAVTKERSLFNVFLPNIDPNIVIDYKKCTFKPKK
jgi:hypothetical protein